MWELISPPRSRYDTVKRSLHFKQTNESLFQDFNVTQQYNSCNHQKFITKYK